MLRAGVVATRVGRRRAVEDKVRRTGQMAKRLRQIEVPVNKPEVRGFAGSTIRRANEGADPVPPEERRQRAVRYVAKARDQQSFHG